MEKHTEDKTIIVCSYEANEPGDYVISVTWGDIEVRGSPFKVNLQKKKVIRWHIFLLTHFPWCFVYIIIRNSASLFTKYSVNVFNWERVVLPSQEKDHDPLLFLLLLNTNRSGSWSGIGTPCVAEIGLAYAHPFFFSKRIQ